MATTRQNMNLLKISDGAAFYICIIAGATGAVAGVLNQPLVAGIAGGIAAIAPIVNRIASGRQLGQLGPRSLSVKQRHMLVEKLCTGSSFTVWVAHNRHEAEPVEYHRQINEALVEAGLETHYFGGMNNNTLGIEISGKHTAEKSRLMAAFAAAKIPFLNVEFSDAPDSQEGFGGIGVWIGVNPGIGR